MAEARILRIVLALSLAPAVGLGIARFAYALLLPDMRADLGWSYATAGWINTTNAFGYLVGALAAASTVRQFGAYRTMLAGAWLCVLAIAGCALFRDFMALNTMRVLAGIGAGYAFVSGGVLISRIAEDHSEKGAFYLGLFYAGPGLGIAISGIAVPWVLADLGPGSWSLAWAILAGISFVLALMLIFARYQSSTTGSSDTGQSSLGFMKYLFFAYSLFGAGYIGYMTFIIAWVQTQGTSARVQAAFWIIIGVGAMSSPWLWSNLLRRQKDGRAFAVLTSIVGAGSLLPLLSGSQPVLMLSAALFGCAFFAVVAATTAFVRRNLPRKEWPRAIGLLTVAFGVGQMLGPIGVGFINDLRMGIAGGQWISTVLLAISAATAILQRDAAPRTESDFQERGANGRRVT